MLSRVQFALQSLLVATAALLATTVITAQTPQPTDPKATPPVPADTTPGSTKELRGPQEKNAKIFQELSRGLLTLAQRLEKSDRPEDKERAKTIYAAIEHSQKAGIDTQYKTLIAGLSKGSENPQDIGGIKGQNAELIKALQEMITILQTDDESERLKKEIATLEQFLKAAEALKRKTENHRAMVEAGKGDASKQANTQKDLADQTKDLAERMGGKKPGDDKKGGEATAKADPKSTPKGEPKPGESSAEAKGDSKDPKANDKDPMAGEKGSEAKEGKPSENAAESKKGGEPKEGEAGEPKGAGEPKAGEPKAGEPKTGEPKAGEPKAGEPKAGEPKAGEPKAGEPKPAGESKGTGQGKGEPKSSKGQQAKGGEGRGKGGEPKPGEQQAQAKPPGDGEPKPGQPGGQSPPPPPPQNQTPGRKQVAEAYPNQKQAEEELKKPDRVEAAKQQDQAIEKLAKAIEELKKKLKQLREEEMLKTLAALEARCNRMLSMQIEVYEGTKVVHNGVVKNNNQKTTADHQKSQQLGDKESEIVAEAEKAMKLLESEGSAVAFAGVLEEVKGDMQAVQKRLAATWVDTDTQAIEENIIQMLKDMIESLKKAQQEIKKSQGEPPPPGGKPGPKPLIDQLAELKLIRAFQTQVNSRTKMYATKYTGEQASDPIVQNELRQLSQRQAKLQDMIQKMATGANK
ncbi:hypothetical protein [Limnoglobus roseus]|uniref:Uncharacterized protein n=1 Tax=Limnoglobus roseus TaxID=2598579 RepID=A0A5C1A763_9BACT|nr:hypothetical protein [Limnoglobus roseus]QEL14027.1 hypothetical protein PX52LOC_00889 [Limnoglobus roseus]